MLIGAPSKPALPAQDNAIAARRRPKHVAVGVLGRPPRKHERTSTRIHA